jgi:putative DNA primase/helicase
MTEIDRARSALQSIDPGCRRESWVRIVMAAKSAGLSLDDVTDWSRAAANFGGEKDCKAVWTSIRDGGISSGTLFRAAFDEGWTYPAKTRSNGHKRHSDAPQAVQPAKAARAQSAANAAMECWRRFSDATADHSYIVAKQGRPDGLRVVPPDDPMTIRGERMSGWLVVPISNATGMLVSLQFIASPEIAARLKHNDIPGKLNLPGASMSGSFTVGELEPQGVAYLAEGIGTAWACWKATGRAAVVCFGWGLVKARAAELRERFPALTIVIVPDVGKESQAEEISLLVQGKVAAMPEGWSTNSDLCDLGLRDGFDAVEAALSIAKEPPKPEPHYKLLTSADLRCLPPLAWCIKRVLPAVGLASIYGPSASGKSFLALDMAAAIASGREWFGLRVTAAPVVYCCLEGESGLGKRVAAWEKYSGTTMPAGLLPQPFKLADAQDVDDLAAVAGKRAVIFIDTLNRAAPMADENASKDMGLILESARTLQCLTGGVVILVHHTGKDATKGLRGHSSLFAALDAGLEVSRNGEHREWNLTKSKDGEDGIIHRFNLNVVSLGDDAEGDPVTSCVVVPDPSVIEARRVKLPQGNNQRIIWDALKPLFKDGVMGKEGAPPYRRCIELEAAITDVQGRLTCEAHRRTERARQGINGLVSRGLLGCNNGWLWVMT